MAGHAGRAGLLCDIGRPPACPRLGEGVARCWQLGGGAACRRTFAIDSEGDARSSDPVVPPMRDNPGMNATTDAPLAAVPAKAEPTIAFVSPG
jgi:hypothetical protein